MDRARDQGEAEAHTRRYVIANALGNFIDLRRRYLERRLRQWSRAEALSVLAALDAGALIGDKRTTFLEDAEEACRLFPRCESISYWLALTYFHLNRLADAHEHLNRVATRRARVVNLHGCIAMEEQRFGPAQAFFEQAVELSASDSSVSASVPLANLIDAHAKQNRFGEAEEVYRRALGAYPVHRWSHYQWSVALALQDRGQEALDSLARVYSGEQAYGDDYVPPSVIALDSALEPLKTRPQYQQIIDSR